jgi:hypothetical protein
VRQVKLPKGFDVVSLPSEFNAHSYQSARFGAIGSIAIRIRLSISRRAKKQRQYQHSDCHVSYSNKGDPSSRN